MSSGSRSHRSHRRRSPLNRFLDRIRGRKHHSHRRHRSENDPDVVEYLKKKHEDDGTQKPPQLEKLDHDVSRHSHKSRSRRSSFFESLDLYFRKRDLKKEQKQKNRLKKKIRKKQQQRYKKEELGRSVPQKLMNVTQDGEKATEKDRRVTWFSKRSIWYRNSTYIFNSTVIFILTYILTYLIYWLTEVFLASLYGIDSTLYYYDLRFNDYSQLWSRFNILVITGLPPFLSLFIGLFLYRRIFKLTRFSGLGKLFILWWSLHSLNHFFGAFASGIVTDEGFGYVAAWLYMNTAIKFLFALISLFMLSVIGYYSKQYFLETALSSSKIKRENHTSFIFSQALIPWIIGMVLIILLRIPHNFDFPYEGLLVFSMGFVVIPAFFNPRVKPKLNFLKLKKKNRLSLKYFLIMVLLVLFYRVMLGIGLHFIIKISISISPATM